MTKKGYWVAMVDIADHEGYKEYIALNKAAFDKYGASFVVAQEPVRLWKAQQQIVWP